MQRVKLAFFVDHWNVSFTNDNLPFTRTLQFCERIILIIKYYLAYVSAKPTPKIITKPISSHCDSRVLLDQGHCRFLCCSWNYNVLDKQSHLLVLTLNQVSQAQFSHKSLWAVEFGCPTSTVHPVELWENAPGHSMSLSYSYSSRSPWGLGISKKCLFVKLSSLEMSKGLSYLNKRRARH